MTIDEGALNQLIEMSQDTHSDAMAASKEPLSEMVEIGLERRSKGDIDPDENRAFAQDRRRLLGKGVFGAGALATAGFGAALMALMEQPAFASSAADVQMLQTSASIENLAVATYGVALTLPFIGGSSANGVVKAFAQMTMQQHKDHGKAFNNAVTSLGGKAQSQPDPVLLGVVNKAKPGLTGPGPVVALALELETGAAETYVANVGALSDSSARQVTASIMGVEAQHAAVLLAVQALLSANAPQLIALSPTVVGKLPAAAGSIGFPNSFYKTDMARPAAEGAVK
ncbi:MAG: ferritin-like domain-containing protein [Acidimicrobiales bacterium]